MPDVTLLLDAAAAGDRQAAADLLPLVYDELRKLAARAWLPKLPIRHFSPPPWCTKRTSEWSDPLTRHAGKIAGTFLRPRPRPCGAILVESARRKKAIKHGGGLHRLDATVAITAPEVDEDLVAIDEALDRLAALDPIKAELVKLRYFAGLTVEQATQTLGISAATAKRYWTYSRIWLYQQVADGNISENR